MTRIALGVEYDGSHYHGWQRQKSGLPTVQQHVETALSAVADHPLQVVCAGRTDAGVHGTGQVIHFDTDSERPNRAWVLGTNSQLPDDIAIRWAAPVADTFHARFSAVSRCYRYVIHNHPIRLAQFNRQLTWNYRPLDLGAMQQAAQALLGRHDFTSYRGVHCQAKSALKIVHRIDLCRQDSLIVLEIEANAFLMHMVRNIAGVLMAIGAGARPVSWCQQVLEAQDRTQGGVTAPPFGLYLVGVSYPDEFVLPETVYGPCWLPGGPIAQAWPNSCSVGV